MTDNRMTDTLRNAGENLRNAGQRVADRAVVLVGLPGAADFMAMAEEALAAFHVSRKPLADVVAAPGGWIERFFPRRRRRDADRL